MNHLRFRLILVSLFIVCLSLTTSSFTGLARPAAPAVPHTVTVIHNTNDILVNDITPYASLTFKIYDQSDTLVYQVTMPTFGNTNYVLFYFQHSVDVQPGFRVSVEDEGSQVVKEVIVQNILVTQFDSGSTFIAGQAPAGASIGGEAVDVNGESYPFTATADQDDYWEYDFSLAYPDLTFDDNTSLYAWISDEYGNRSEYASFTVRPGMEVGLGADVVYGLNLTASGLVDLEVYQSGEKIFGPWQLVASNDGFAAFDLWKWGFHLVPGMQVKMHELTRDILKSIDLVPFTGSHNPVTNILSGYAPPDRSFPLEICLVTLPCYHVNVTADNTGYWEYDLGTDVLSGWTAFLYDDDGDALNPDDGRPPRHPTIYTDLNNDTISPGSYAPDANASLRVFPTDVNAAPVISETIQMSSWGSMRFDAGILGVDLLPDMVVEVEDILYNGATRPISMTLDFIAITDFITATNTVAGLADPLTDVQVWAYEETSGWHDQWKTSDAAGKWQVVFDSALAISTIGANVEDANGHATGFDFRPGGTIQQIQPEGGTLTTFDQQGDQTLISIPTGAVTSTISLAFNPLSAIESPSGFAFTDTAFELTAYQDGLPLRGYTFETPIEIALHYSEEDITDIDETSLTLYYWDDSAKQWIDAATTCTPTSPYDRQLAENYVSVQICHLSKFSLFGDYQYRVFVPAILSKP